MKQESVETPEVEVLGTVAIGKTEQFFEENGKKIAGIILLLFVVAASFFGYKSFVLEPQEQSAADAMYASQGIFEAAAPDYQVALDGDASSIGFLAVIDQYGSTPTGNIARHYAGVCYMKLGDFDNALKYLTSYKKQQGSAAEIIYAQNIGLQGDIAVERGDYAGAVKLFKSASESSENPLTAPMYLRKAGVAAQAAGDSKMARELFESVVREYPSSAESRTAEKYIGTLN